MKKSISGLLDKFIANAFDSKDNTVRGSFISQLLTLFMGYIVYRAINDSEVTARVKDLTELILGFYFLSIGIWKTGKILKCRVDKNMESDGEK